MSDAANDTAFLQAAKLRIAEAVMLLGKQAQREQVPPGEFLAAVTAALANAAGVLVSEMDAECRDEVVLSLARLIGVTSDHMAREFPAGVTVQ